MFGGRCLVEDVWWKMFGGRCLVEDVWWKMFGGRCLVVFYIIIHKISINN